MYTYPDLFIILMLAFDGYPPKRTADIPTQSIKIIMLEKTEEQSIVAENDVTALQNIKHPLEHMWHFWFFTNKSKNWETNQVELTSFGTVEDYWCLYHHMKLPSELRLGQDYAIFKDGIRPMWEDAANKSGGRWLINGLKNHNVDSVWTDTVLQVIGENFIHSDIICGVVVNVRAESKVSIWTRIKDPKANKEIGLRLKSHFGLQNEIHYLAHKRNSSLFTV